VALVPVSTYAVGWNPATDKGRMYIQITGLQPQEVPISSQEELLIMLLMMAKSGVQFDTVTKEVSIPFRPTGS